MARVTVEDCMDHVDNLFDLVLISAKRARKIANGAQALVERNNDKPTVIALREVAAGLVDKSILDETETEIFQDPFQAEPSRPPEPVSLSAFSSDRSTSLL